MNLLTQIKQLEVECPSEKNGWRMGGNIPVPGHSSRGYHGLFKIWADHVKQTGAGILTGEDEPSVGYILCDEILSIDSLSLVNYSKWDLTEKPYPHNKVDFIFSQATLEHVHDPFGALKNMSNSLLSEGRIYLHTHGPDCKLHRYPVDCCRFFPDFFKVAAQKLDLTIEDCIWTSHHCFYLFKNKEQRGVFKMTEEDLKIAEESERKHKKYY